MILLVGASLLIRSFSRIVAVDPGFDAARILHGRVALNASYNEAGTRVFFDQVVQKMREIPGVEAVGISSHIPINGQTGVGAFPIRGSTPGQEDVFPTASVIGVSPDYFSAMRISLLEGRAFNAADLLPQARRVLIVDRTFAAKFFPGRSAVGEGFLDNGANAKPDSWPLIVGVAEVVKYNGPEDRSGLPLVYVPMGASGGLSIELRTDRPMADIVPRMRAALRSLDPALPLYSVGTMQMAVDGALANRRGVMWLLGAFAGVALLLSAVGIYGMLAYDVAQRTREIGIRGAIGASRGQIVTLILRQGLWKTGVGLVIGLGGAFYLSRYMGSLLFEVKPTDPFAFIGVSLLLLLVALLASWLPARRAAKIDPVIALRAE